MASKQILVVDDEIGIRELLSEILFDEGYQVHLAENAAQARAYRNEFEPDMVLLDIWMPDTDGVTLLKEWVEQDFHVGTSKNPFSGRIAVSRARSLLAYQFDMSRCSLRGSLRFIPRK